MTILQSDDGHMINSCWHFTRNELFKPYCDVLKNKAFTHLKIKMLKAPALTEVGSVSVLSY